MARAYQDWECGNCVGRDNDGAWIIVGSDGNRVAVASFKGTAKRGNAWNAPDPEGQANAQLIAAAPEMYEALETALEALHHTLRNVCNSPKYCTRCKVEAVLAKARGEEK